MTHSQRKTIFEDDILTVEQIGDKTTISIFYEGHYQGSYEFVTEKDYEITEVKPLD